jgi:uncharacterized protein with HEPN domain
MKDKHNHIIYLKDMLENLAEAAKHAQVIEDIKLKKIDISKSYLHHYDINPLRSAIGNIERSFEIAGEAAKRVPDEVRKKYPGIAWKEIAGMRDVIIHNYRDVALKRLLSTAKEDIPQTITELRKAIRKEKSQEIER